LLFLAGFSQTGSQQVSNTSIYQLLPTLLQQHDKKVTLKNAFKLACPASGSTTGVRAQFNME
jgi:hypothetical protein